MGKALLFLFDKTFDTSDLLRKRFFLCFMPIAADDGRQGRKCEKSLFMFSNIFRLSWAQTLPEQIMCGCVCVDTLL